MNLPAIRPSDPYVVVPATDDGIACAMVLGRRNPRPAKIWCVPPFSLASFFEFPAWHRVRAGAHLLIAGFNNTGSIREAILRAPAAQITWWTHHFWDEAGEREVASANVALRRSPEFSSTCAWLLEELAIDDPASREIACAIAIGRIPEPLLKPWFLVSLAVRSEPPQVERALANWIVNAGPPDEEWRAQGEGVWESLSESYENANRWSFAAAREGRASVLPIPRSMVAHFPVLAEIAWARGGDHWIVLLVDREDHLILRLNPRLRAEPLRAARLVDEALGDRATRLFDRLTLLVETERLGPIGTVEALAKNAHLLDFAATDC
ncbi:MAG: hypothetical protein KJ042_16410 [Deltaproteobacteria bacterium]|nr:hypothetical protein [Deltaproteobacteria bacterium]